MKYISFYDDKKNRRNMSLAAVNKINYICEALNKNGYDIDIISCSMGASEKIKKTTEKLAENINIHYFKTKKISKNKIMRLLECARRNIILFAYLMRKVRRQEEVIVYHSLGLMRTAYWAKKLKRFKLVLEVEEFYNDVFLKSGSSKQMEQKFIDCADKYIFPTELLNEKFNKQNKPYAIIHGTYQVEPDYDETFNDEKIHIVYAGTFDPRKGGAVAAASTAMCLPENYHIHILGFGSRDDIANIKKVIQETNEKSKALVTYDGLLSGDEYIRFLQKCHIGLSTQNPDAAFNATSFPSKILSYMANGLRVVTIRIPAIEGSLVGRDLYYYDNQTPENIAKAIMDIDLNDGYDSRVKISKIDKKFRDDLKILLGD